jgi:hypothetical protein
MCLRVSVDVYVLGWALIYLCVGGGACVCVFGWGFLYVC